MCSHPVSAQALQVISDASWVAEKHAANAIPGATLTGHSRQVYEPVPGPYPQALKTRTRRVQTLVAL